MGWTAQDKLPLREKCVICVAPHTSNWDFVIGQLYYRSIGRRANFLMKKEWFFWPLGYFFRAMGGIPVYRSRKSSMTDTIAQHAREAENFALAITPEGTRSLTTTWKRGFYYIALKASIPIQCYALDYKHRRIVGGIEIMPSGDERKDLKLIMEFYRNFKGKHPELFSIEDIF